MSQLEGYTSLSLGNREVNRKISIGCLPVAMLAVSVQSWPQMSRVGQLVASRLLCDGQSLLEMRYVNYIQNNQSRNTIGVYKLCSYCGTILVVLILFCGQTLRAYYIGHT